ASSASRAGLVLLAGSAVFAHDRCAAIRARIARSLIAPSDSAMEPRSQGSARAWVTGSARSGTDQQGPTMTDTDRSMTRQTTVIEALPVPVAERHAAVGLAGPLVGGTGRVTADHLPRLPAGQAHQVRLLTARVQPGVGEGVPEL